MRVFCGASLLSVRKVCDVLPLRWVCSDTRQKLSCTVKREVRRKIGLCNMVCAVQLKPLFAGLAGVTF